MATELATAYVSIVPSLRGFQPPISKELSRAEKSAGGAGKRMGSKIVSGLAKTVKVGAVAAGVAVGASLIGGFKSAMDQQNAQKVLGGLYGSAKEAKTMMASLRDVAKVSPVGYSSYLKAAEALAYSGVKGDEATKSLENMGKAITAVGGTDEDMTRATDAVMTMVNAGKVSLDSLQQLSGSGVPIISGLAEHFGKSMDDINKMASDGDIGLEDVLSVMEKGTGDTFQTMIKAGEEASKSFGNQMKIAKDNVVTALGTYMVPLLDKLAPLVSKAGDALSGFVERTAKGMQGLYGLLVKGNFTGAFREAFNVEEDSKLVDYLFRVRDAAAQAFDYIRGTVIPALQSFGGFLMDNKNVLAVLVGGIVGYRIATVASTAVTAVWTTVAKAAKLATAGWAVQQRILNVAMKANVIGIVVTALTLLIAGVVLAYNKIGWFKDGVNAAWAGIKTAVSAVVSWFQNTVWPILTSVWDGIAAGATWLWKNVLEPAWQGILTAVSVVVTWFTNTALPVIQSVFKTVGAVFTWLWEHIVKPVFGFIKDFIGVAITVIVGIFKIAVAFVRDVLAPIFTWLYQNIVKPVFWLIQTYIKAWWWTVSTIFKVVVALIRNVLGPVFTWLYEHIIKPVFAAIKDYISSVWNNRIKPIFEAIKWFLNNVLGPVFKWLYDKIIKPVFDWIGNKIKGVWEDKIKPTFDLLKAGVKKVPAAFEAAKDGITKAWDKIKEAAKKPVVFVVDKVMGGLVEAFWLIPGLNKGNLPKPKLPKGFRKGGYTGPGRPDEYAGPAHKDEHIIKSPSRRRFEAAHPGALDHINQHGSLPAGLTAGRANPASYLRGQLQSEIEKTRNLVIKPFAGVTRGMAQMAASAWNGRAGVKATVGSLTPYEPYSSVFTGYGPMPSGSNFIGYFQDHAIQLKPGNQLPKETLIHEVGHALGLGHSVGPTTIMHPSLQGGTSWPSAYDSGTLRGLYGAPGSGSSTTNDPGGNIDDGPTNPFDGLIDKLMDAIKAKFPNAGMFVDAAGGLAKSGIDQVVKMVTDIKNGIKNIAGDVFNKIKGFFGGGAAMAPSTEAPLLRDQGGIIPPGMSSVLNRTGQNEYVLNPTQWTDMHKLATGNGAPTEMVGNLYLDSGELLGKFKGVATQVADQRIDAAGRAMAGRRVGV